MPKDFEKELEGLKKDEKKKFIVKFPDNSKKVLAGREIEFKATIINIEQMILPEINDQFAKDFGNFENIEDLKKNIKERIKNDKENQEKNIVLSKILEKISQQIKINLPKTIIENEKENMLADLKNQIKNQLKISFEEYLNQTKQDNEKLDKSLTEQAEKRIKELLIIKEIGQQEKVEVADNETGQAMEHFLKNLPEEKRAKLDQSQLMAYYKDIIYNEKVLKILNSYVDNNSNNN